MQKSLQWRHNEHDGVSNHLRLGCLLNCFYRRRSKKTSKHRVTGFCEGNSPVTGEFPAQRASNAENISIWWRHHDGRRDLEKSCPFECYTRPCDYHVSLHQNNYGAQYTPPLALSIIATCLKCKPLSVFWVASSNENISTDWACTPFRPWTLFGLNTLHSKNYKHGFGIVMFCCDLLQVDFTHFFQGLLTGTGAVMWLSQCQLRVGSPEEYGKMKNMNTRWLPHMGKITKWWRHQMESFSALLALCAGNSPVTGEFPSQRPVTRKLWCFLWSAPE